MNFFSSVYSSLSNTATKAFDWFTPNAGGSVSSGFDSNLFGSLSGANADAVAKGSDAFTNSVKISGGGWGDTLSGAMNWMQQNPEIVKVGAGLIGGAAQGYTAHQQMKMMQDQFAKEMAQRERFNQRRASSGKGYDSHSSNLVGGTGLLAPELDKRY